MAWCLRPTRASRRRVAVSLDLFVIVPPWFDPMISRIHVRVLSLPGCAYQPLRLRATRIPVPRRSMARGTCVVLARCHRSRPLCSRATRLTPVYAGTRECSRRCPCVCVGLLISRSFLTLLSVAARLVAISTALASGCLWPWGVCGRPSLCFLFASGARWVPVTAQAAYQPSIWQAVRVRRPVEAVYASPIPPACPMIRRMCLPGSGNLFAGLGE